MNLEDILYESSTELPIIDGVKPIIKKSNTSQFKFSYRFVYGPEDDSGKSNTFSIYKCQLGKDGTYRVIGVIKNGKFSRRERSDFFSKAALISFIEYHHNNKKSETQ